MSEKYDEIFGETHIGSKRNKMPKRRNKGIENDKTKIQEDKEDEILEKEIHIKKKVFEEMPKYPENATIKQKSQLDKEYLRKCQNALNALRNENKQKEAVAIKPDPDNDPVSFFFDVDEVKSAELVANI